MGLLGKIFTNKGAAAPQPAPAPQPSFADSDIEGDGEQERLQQRRDVILRVLRDTMGQHGIPSDWIDVRMVAGDAPGRGTGLHVQLIVRQGHDRLLNYIFAFQESFRSEFARAEPRADWLHSLAWEFVDTGALARGVPGGPARAGVAAGAMAAASQPAPLPAFAAEEREERIAAEEPFARAKVDDPGPDEVEEDLQALYAALGKPAPAKSSDSQPDFEPTRPADPF